MNLVKIVKYYFLGGLVNVCGYFLYLIFLYLGFGHKFTATVFYFLGVIVSFFMNRRFVFDSGISLKSGSYRLFAMLCFGYIVNMSILYFFVDLLGLHPGVIQLISIGIVSIIFYLLNNNFVHRKGST